MAHQNPLASKTVLVFGGTSGIGFAIANMALSNSARVIISGSTQPKVDSKVAELRSYYPSLPSSSVSGLALDLLDTPKLESNILSFFETVTSSGANKIDHIAYTAVDGAPLTKVSEADVEKAMHPYKLRILAPLMIAKAIATGKYVPLTSGSSFTTTGGTNSRKPLPGWTITAAAGMAAEGQMRGLAVDLAPVRVNMVEPGAVRTELLQGYLERAGPEAEAMFEAQSLVRKLGAPQDVAEAYGWFMRDGFVTGTVASSDGGRLLA